MKPQLLVIFREHLGYSESVFTGCLVIFPKLEAHTDRKGGLPWFGHVWVQLSVSVCWCREAVATEVNGLSRLNYNLVCSNRTDLSYCNLYPPICVSGILLFASWMESPVRLHSNYHNHLLQFTHPTFYYLSTTQPVSPVLKYLNFFLQTV